MRMPSYLRIATGAAAVFLFSLPSPAGDNKENDPDQIGNREGRTTVPTCTRSRRRSRSARSLAPQVERQAKIIDEPQIAEYVNRLGQNLVRNSDAKVPFTIKVIDTEEVNAFALPGGFFYVNSGLILKADTEAELAGVMAHEIAHVAARHGTRQATKGDYRAVDDHPADLLRRLDRLRHPPGGQRGDSGGLSAILQGV